MVPAPHTSLPEEWINDLSPPALLPPAPDHPVLRKLTWLLILAGLAMGLAALVLGLVTADSLP
jgi:hypothetical protein